MTQLSSVTVNGEGIGNENSGSKTEGVIILEYTNAQIEAIGKRLDKSVNRHIDGVREGYIYKPVKRISIGTDGLYTYSNVVAKFKVYDYLRIPNYDAAHTIISELRHMVVNKEIEWAGDQSEMPSVEDMENIKRNASQGDTSNTIRELGELLKNLFVGLGINNRVELKVEYYEKMGDSGKTESVELLREGGYVNYCFDKDLRRIELDGLTYDSYDKGNGVTIYPDGELELGNKVDKQCLAVALLIVATKNMAPHQELIFKAAKQLKNSSKFFSSIFDKKGNVLPNAFLSHKDDLVSFAREMYEAAGYDTWPVDPSDRK